MIELITDEEIEELYDSEIDRWSSMKVVFSGELETIKKLIEHYQRTKDRQWVSVDDRLPKTKHEHDEFDDDGEICVFSGSVSDSMYITDGYKHAMGHYRDDGTWDIYGGEHDFQLIDEDAIKYWKELQELPPQTNGEGHENKH